MLAPRERAGTRAVERRVVHGTDRRRPAGWVPGAVVAMAMATMAGTIACASRPTVVAVPSSRLWLRRRRRRRPAGRRPPPAFRLRRARRAGRDLGAVRPALRQRHGPDGSGNAVAVGRSSRADDLHLHGVRTSHAAAAGRRPADGRRRLPRRRRRARPARTERGGRAGRRVELSAARARGRCGHLGATRRQERAAHQFRHGHPRPGPEPRPVPLPPVDLLTDIARRVLARLPPNPPHTRRTTSRREMGRPGGADAGRLRSVSEFVGSTGDVRVHPERMTHRTMTVCVGTAHRRGPARGAPGLRRGPWAPARAGAAAPAGGALRLVGARRAGTRRAGGSRARPRARPRYISSPLVAASASAPRTSGSPSRSRPGPRAVQDERGLHQTIGSDGCWTHHLIQVTAEAPAARPSYEGSAWRATGCGRGARRLTPSRRC